MREEGEKIGFCVLMGWHGRTTTGTGRAKLLENEGFRQVWSSTAVPPQARAVPNFWSWPPILFFFLRIMFGQIPAKQIKITQNKQNKSNKTCGLPPTKRSFKVISLTIKRFLYPIPNLSLRDKGIKLTLSPKSNMTFSMVSDPMAQGMEKLSGSLSLGGNLFGIVSIKFLNCSSNLDLANSCVKEILGSWGGETSGFCWNKGVSQVTYWVLTITRY